MHRSMLVSHSESLVANNEYAALVTLRYLLMPLVVSAQGHLKNNPLFASLSSSGYNLASTNVLCNAKC
jgi:hypothetical protein